MTVPCCGLRFHTFARCVRHPCKWFGKQYMLTSVFNVCMKLWQQSGAGHTHTHTTLEAQAQVNFAPAARATLQREQTSSSFVQI